MNVSFFSGSVFSWVPSTFFQGLAEKLEDMNHIHCSREITEQKAIYAMDRDVAFSGSTLLRYVPHDVMA